MEVPFKPSNDNVMSEGSASRLLSPSLMHGKFAPAQQFSRTSTTPFRSGVNVEKREMEHDYRFVYLQALEDVYQPRVEANLPDGLLSINLLRHQKMALAWAIQKENRGSPCVGGFLADEQKYLEEKFKSYVVPKQETEAFNLDDDDDDKIKVSGESTDTMTVPVVSTSVKATSKSKLAAGTLVVCPASVLWQWARELDEKVAEEAKLSVLLYHGGNRTKDPIEMAKYEVVITTYSIVANEAPKQPFVYEEGEEEKIGEACGLSSDFSRRGKSQPIICIKGKKVQSHLKVLWTMVVVLSQK